MGARAFLAVLCAALAAAAPAQPIARSAPSAAPPDNGNWEMPGKNYASTRFSAMRQITPANVAQLKPILTYPTGTNKGHEAPPLVVGSTMYLFTPFPNRVYAIDLAAKPRAKLKWIFRPEPVPAAQGVACCDVVNRGGAYADGKIFFNTLDGQTLAIDARSGQMVWRTKLGDINKGETITMAPLVAGGKVLVGNSGGEMGVRGWIAALEKEEGFENKIVRIVAEELGADVTYVWRAQRRGLVREALNEGECDLIPGVASSLEMLATTRPYYRSTYVAVARKGPLSDLDNFDDARLPGLRIGVQMIGDDGANSPPAHSLSRRGMIDNVRGYSVFGDYADAAPQSAIVEAVARGDVDIAFVWGPTAGYFARRQQVPLTLVPIEPQSDGPTLPMLFDVSMGVRRADRDLKREVEDALARRSADIDAILKDYGVPLVHTK